MDNIIRHTVCGIIMDPGKRMFVVKWAPIPPHKRGMIDLVQTDGGDEEDWRDKLSAKMGGAIAPGEWAHQITITTMGQHREALTIVGATQELGPFWRMDNSGWALINVGPVDPFFEEYKYTWRANLAMWSMVHGIRGYITTDGDHDLKKLELSTWWRP